MRKLLVLAGTVLVAGCASRTAEVSVPVAAPAALPLASSLATPQGSWAIAEMGGSASGEENFWQLFVRPAGSASWSLATPPGVADNGGLVAAGGSASLVVGFRASQSLAFSPLATSTDTGKNWAPGVLGAGLADTPDALSVGPSGQELALLTDGTIDTSASGASWTRLTSVKALAASAAGRSCGLTAVSAMSFWPNGSKVVAGGCERRGVSGVFTDAGGTWQADGPTLPGAGQEQVRVLRLSGSSALLAAGGDVFAAWYGAGRWTVSAPLAGAGLPRASGFGADGTAWVLLAGGHAETISGPGGAWQELPAVPAATAVLVPGDSYDALTVTGSSGSTATVWRLTAGSWTKAQVINVPIAAGSSS